MTTQERILSALKLLEKVTPLKGDCGRVCGAACCQSDETGKGGMLLFPGEKALYYEEKTDWMELQETSVPGISGLWPAGFSRWPPRRGTESWKLSWT